MEQQFYILDNIRLLKYVSEINKFKTFDYIKIVLYLYIYLYCLTLMKYNDYTSFCCILQPIKLTMQG